MEVRFRLDAHPRIFGPVRTGHFGRLGQGAKIVFRKVFVSKKPSSVSGRAFVNLFRSSPLPVTAFKRLLGPA
jgi:hypothetical protein